MDLFSKISRRIDALENARSAVLRFGSVVGVDEKDGSVRVQLSDADDIVSKSLRMLQPRTLKDQHQELPDLGEPVACLFSGQGLEEGVLLGAVYNKMAPAPGRPPQVWYRRFEDGTEFEYDRKEHRLTLKVNGDIVIEASGTIKINANHVSIQE